MSQVRLMTELASDVVASHPLRIFFRRSPGNVDEISMTDRGEQDAKKDDFLFVLTLLSDEKHDFLGGLTDLLDQLEHLVAKVSKHKDKISNLVSNTLSNINIVALLQNELDNYHPWTTGIKYELSKVRAAVKQEVNK